LRREIPIARSCCRGCHGAISPGCRRSQADCPTRPAPRSSANGLNRWRPIVAI